MLLFKHGNLLKCPRSKCSLIIHSVNNSHLLYLAVLKLHLSIIDANKALLRVLILVLWYSSVITRLSV
jgi:hypothetical protein